MCRRLPPVAVVTPLVQMRLGPSGLIEVVTPFDPVTQAQLRRKIGRAHV